MRRKKLVVAVFFIGIILSIMIGFPVLGGVLYTFEKAGLELEEDYTRLLVVTDEEKYEAEKIAMNDVRVKQLLLDKEFSVVDFGPITFTSQDNKITRYGVFLKIEFDKPCQVDYDYPDRRYQNRNLEEYEEMYFNYSGIVECIGIFVDTSHQQIERIIPMEKAPPQVLTIDEPNL